MTDTELHSYASSGRTVYVCEGVRTAIGSFTGSLSMVRADDLAAHVVKRLVEKAPALDPAAVDEVILGCANQSGEDNRNVARMSALLAGIPETVPAYTVNRLCASGLTAAIDGARAIAVGEAEVVIAGGVEHMTRAPYVLSKSSAPFGRNAELFDTTLGWRFVNPKMQERFGVDSMGETAENLAERYGISREEQDGYALQSQQRAAAAQARGRFAEEIAPIEIAGAKGAVSTFEHDEFVKPGTSIEALAKLKPAFRKDGKGSVTAGNAAGLNDGAVALILASEAAVARYGLTPVARIRAASAAGVEPRVMGIGPVEAVHRVLTRAKLTVADIEVIEINEAFAVQVLACARELGIDPSDPRLNPNGGAIALGHPLGMSGARLLLTAALELRAKGKGRALCSMCVGVGQGVASLIEAV